MDLSPRSHAHRTGAVADAEVHECHVRSMITHRNINFATVSGLREVLGNGAIVRVRGEEVREILNHVTSLAYPCERCLFLPGRGNNVFATIAETMWVLQGRDDVEWLARYLPRAREFSDDGLAWRGAYGPRLRNWAGVDQLDEVRRLLLADPATRRAAMVIFDPARDFVDSKDIPCSNWLHWVVRGERLHLNVAIRSNDVIWGFSGVNSFEWSVLHEMMAHWVGRPVGTSTYFATSFHVYHRHYDRAERIVGKFPHVTCYDFGVVTSPFQTSWDDFGEALDRWFAAEEEFFRKPGTAWDAVHLPGDPLLDDMLRVLRLYNGASQGWDAVRLRDELALLQPSDLTAAAYEYFGRTYRELKESAPQRAIRAFFDASGSTATGHAGVAARVAAQKARIKALHAEKDAAYGNAWKRRGELTSILANIARKIDRLEVFVGGGAELSDESLLDTAIDLFVYVTKYRLYLLELAPAQADTLLSRDLPQPLSDHVSNFDYLVDIAHFLDGEPAPLSDLIMQGQHAFNQLHCEASTSIAPSSSGDRLLLASRLSDVSIRILIKVAHTGAQQRRVGPEH